MIKREDFIFTVGYQGDTAIVNGELKGRYGKLQSVALAEKGLFKPAVCSALFDKNEDDLAEVLSIYNKHIDKPLNSPADLKKTLGVTDVPDGIMKISII